MENKIELNFGWSVFFYLSHLKGTLLAVLNASVGMGRFLASKEFISGSSGSNSKPEQGQPLPLCLLLSLIVCFLSFSFIEDPRKPDLCFFATEKTATDVSKYLNFLKSMIELVRWTNVLAEFLNFFLSKKGFILIICFTSWAFFS